MQYKQAQLDKLYNHIVGVESASGTEQFYVFPIEAGLGKTTTMIRALKRQYKINPNIKSIIVTSFIKEAKALHEKLKGISLVFPYKKKTIDKQTILDTPILIITQAKYKQLCIKGRKKNTEEWRLYSEGRRNLIIDEELQFSDFVHFDIFKYAALRNSLREIDSSILPYFDSIFAHIFSLLKDMTKEEYLACHIHEPNPLKVEEKDAIKKIISKINKTKGNREFYLVLKYKLSQQDAEYVCNWYDIITLMRDLISIAKSTFFIYDHNGIHCMQNRKIKTLENNIMLDASASIVSIYQHTECYNVIKMDRIVSHDKWNLHLCKLATSARKKRLSNSFYQGVALQIQKICSDERNKLLVISDAKDVGGKELSGKIQVFYPEMCNKFKGQLAFANFNSVRGRNDWSDFNNVLIPHTPYLPTYFYPLLLKFFMPEYRLKNSDLGVRYSNKKGVERTYFVDAVLDEYRQTDIAASYYQAVKRISRNNTPNVETHIYLITDNMDAVNKLITHLPGIKYSEFNLPGLKKAKAANRSYHRKEESRFRVKLRDLLNEMAEGKYRYNERHDKPGFYKKKWCMEQIGVSSNFSRLLRNMEAHMIEIGISSNQHNIIINKFK